MLDALLDHKKGKSVSRVLKDALTKLFSDGVIVRDRSVLQHDGKAEAVVFTTGTTDEIRKVIHRKDAEKKRILKKKLSEDDKKELEALGVDLEE
jgi:hypothetical protein